MEKVRKQADSPARGNFLDGNDGVIVRGGNWPGRTFGKRGDEGENVRIPCMYRDILLFVYSFHTVQLRSAVCLF